jgi:hypothetical protein
MGCLGGFKNMRPSVPYRLPYTLAETYDQDRYRGEELRHVLDRGLLETRVERPLLPARLAAAILRIVRRDRHSMTNYPCRLPDGKIGRTAVVLADGDWTLVCRVA